MPISFTTACFNNQLLPVTHRRRAGRPELFKLVQVNPGITFEVDLEAQVVKAGDKTYWLWNRRFPPPLHTQRHR
ncbi:hypothetical protein MJ390_05205 [Klebsiella pneumoniae]|nr:hypothetical protein MJ390_05205 [Klebsiella pneumoniae]